MSERRQSKLFASSIRSPYGHTILRDDRDAADDEPGWPVTVIEGHEPVYTLADVEAAVRWAFRNSVPTCVDDALYSSGEDAIWQAYRKTLEGEG